MYTTLLPRQISGQYNHCFRPPHHQHSSHITATLTIIILHPTFTLINIGINISISGAITTSITDFKIPLSSPLSPPPQFSSTCIPSLSPSEQVNYYHHHHHHHNPSTNSIISFMIFVINTFTFDITTATISASITTSINYRSSHYFLLRHR